MAGFTLSDGEQSLSNADASFYNNDPTDPNSAFYVPPSGTYQANSGAVVPTSTPSTLGTTPTASTTNTDTSTAIPTTSTSILGGVMSAMNPLSGFKLPSLENVIFLIVGIILIAAGLFAFKQTQNVIETGGRIAKNAALLAP